MTVTLQHNQYSLKNTNSHVEIVVVMKENCKFVTINMKTETKSITKIDETSANFLIEL